MATDTATKGTKATPKASNKPAGGKKKAKAQQKGNASGKS